MCQWTNLRKSFADFVNGLNPKLKGLAADIARAGGQGFLSGNRSIWQKPANFLANGNAANSNARFWPTALASSRFYYDIRTGWRDKEDTKRALVTLLKELAAWKEPGPDASHLGFNVSPKNPPGLALLFDPLVDFALAAHLLNEGFQHPLRVLVLTDYYPLVWNAEDLVGALTNPGGQGDWAQRNTLNLKQASYWENYAVDRTAYWLAKCLGPDHLLSPTRQIFVQNRLLLWNFFPFFQGGFATSGENGLPPWNATYRAKCLEWLFLFVLAVDATELIIATNKTVFPLICEERKATTPIQSLADLKDLDTYPGTRELVGKLVSRPQVVSPNLGKIYRVPHPYSWAKKELRESLRQTFCLH